jgi:DNA-binding protein H-NS
MALWRRLLTIATAVFVGTTACHRRSEDDLQRVDETTAVHESRESDDRMLEEQRRLASAVAALEKQQAVFKERMAEQRNAIARSERRVRDLKHDVQQKKAETNAYIDRHELQVACAYARQVARGEGEYSEKTRNCARIASMYCAVAMLSPTFRRKVALVKQHVDKAEADAQSRKKQLSSEEQNMKAEKAKLQSTQESIDRIASDIVVLRQQQRRVSVSPSSMTRKPSSTAFLRISGSADASCFSTRIFAR